MKYFVVDSCSFHLWHYLIKKYFAKYLIFVIASKIYLIFKKCHKIKKLQLLDKVVIVTLTNLFHISEFYESDVPNYFQNISRHMTQFFILG